MAKSTSINPILNDAISYLHSLFGLQGEVHHVNTNDMANYLKKYDYCGVDIDHVQLLLFHCPQKELPHINTLHKNMSRMYSSWNEDVNLVLVLSKSNKHQRNLLLSERISFIVPGSQMYVPALGTVLNENIRAMHEVDDHLSPLAQRAIFEFLENEEVPQAQIVLKLGYSKSSISRTLNELSDHGLIHSTSVGTMKVWRRSKDLRGTWDILKNTMNNAIKKGAKIKERGFEPYNSNLRLFEAGESYLTTYSMLSQPAIKTYAISEADWHANKGQFIECQYGDDRYIHIQIWHQDIPLLNGCIHPLAIYSTYVGDTDPRIQESVEYIVNKYLEDFT